MAWIEVVDKKLSIKKNGRFHTPINLADHLVSNIQFKNNDTIFDPAYGDGSLLIAANKACNQKFKIFNHKLFGCDIFDSKKYQINNNGILWKKDFFTHSYNNKYNIILVNPPFVRRKYLTDYYNSDFPKIVAEILPISQNSDLWLHFLIKSIGHLKHRGQVGAILPRSLLQANYAHEFRKYIAENFEEISILNVNAKFFDKINERVILLWLKNYGKKVERILIANTENIENRIKYNQLSKKQFFYPIVKHCNGIDPFELLKKYKEIYGYDKLEQHVLVKSGLVTGADKFFIISKSKANEIGILNKNRIPIINSLKNNIKGFMLNGSSYNKILLKFENCDDLLYKDYLKIGEGLNLKDKPHFKSRKPWYVINVKGIPDGFFPYRQMKFPYLVNNIGNIICTNSIHQIYYNNLSDTEIKWLQLSTLTYQSQLSIELYSKIYGNGILKIEPNNLKGIIVYISNNKNVIDIYYEVSKLLGKRQIISAIELTSKFFKNILNIDDELYADTVNCLNTLQNQRISR